MPNGRRATLVPEDKKSAHLILLVGGNPLPNAVAARLLVAEGGVVSLVCSEESSGIARGLADFLASHGCTVHEPFYKVDEARPVSIRREVTAALNAHLGKAPGLHYTGGTKAMSVHAYRAVEDWARVQHFQPVFSYLDARTMKLLIDPKPDDPASASETTVADNDPRDNDPRVGRERLVTLPELAELHGWTNFHQGGLFLVETARALHALLSGDNTQAPPVKDWYRWCGELKAKLLDAPAAPGRGERWKLPWQLTNLVMHWPPDSCREVAAALRKELSEAAVGGDGGFNIVQALDIVNQADPSSKTPLLKKTAEVKVKDLHAWFQAKWLETAVFDALRPMRDVDHQLDDLVLSLEPGRTDGTKFEVDVVALRGYRLFVFSCSTKRSGAQAEPGERSELKEHLFEADIRARGLGGDHASVALVCLTNQPDQLQAELHNTFKALSDRPSQNPVGERIRVFGRAPLHDLKLSVQEWILKQVPTR